MAEIVSSNPVNEASEKEVRTRSSFKLDYPFYQTMRFGEYTPHFVMEGVDSDKLPLHSSHTIKSYTLKAPLMSDLKINKDYFMVPMQAILPINWSKWYANPVKGQDVPVDCGPSVENFWSKIASLASVSFTKWRSDVNDLTSVSAILNETFQVLIFFERFYSDGSLLSNLGIHGCQFFNGSSTTDGLNIDMSYDQLFDRVISGIASSIPYFGIKYNDSTGYDYFVECQAGSSPLSDVSKTIGLRDFLELLRDDFSWNITTIPTGYDSNTLQNAIMLALNDVNYSFKNVEVHLDLRRLWAYQLVCWHYYTNDKVDYIYSAELFRSYIRELTSRAFSYTGTGSISPSTAILPHTFVVNGLTYEYDALSAYNLSMLLQGFGLSNGIFGLKTGSTIPADQPTVIANYYAYFRALFGFNNSLRYKDYFTSAKTQPLAVGDVSAPVASNLVNVIDVTRNIQKQRFLNFINRIPQQIEDYLGGLFGKRPAPDYHNPFFLARTTDDVFGQESEYTGNVSSSDANNITSLLRSQASRYAFELDVDREVVVIGISSFDLERAYSRSIERQALHLDRFDGFNPFMQFVGDQPVYDCELGNVNASMLPFGYQLRHMEYKQRYPQCAGGFRKFLPGWLFIADDTSRVLTDNQDPNFIRSHNTEIDKFYVSLTGFSLGSYFHFIVKNVNSMTASRPMAYAPSIL